MLKLPNTSTEIIRAQYSICGWIIEIKELNSNRSNNKIIVGTRIDDQKDVIIKYIERQDQDKKNRQYREKTSLSDYSFHPNLVSLLAYQGDNIVVLEKGYRFNESSNFYFGNKDFNDRADLLKCLFSQYVVFLSFGHYKKIYQRDVKFDNSVIYPSIYSDQAPHLKVIDFELSSDVHIATTAICPHGPTDTTFIDSIQGGTYHSHLMDSYYLCLSFGNINKIKKLGFDNITQKDIDEITNLASSDTHTTLYEVLNTNFIQERSIHFYNYLPDASNHYEVVKVKDIVQRIEERREDSTIFIRYLSTPHIFNQERITFNNILFPYYSISSVYIIPKSTSLNYKDKPIIDRLKRVLGELILNIKFLNDQCSNQLKGEKSDMYSFISKSYFNRYEQLKEDLKGSQTYTEVANYISTRSLKTLVGDFQGKVRYYQQVLDGRGYYSRINEYNNKSFDLSNINQMNKSFKVIEEAINIINNVPNESSESKSTIEFNGLDLNKEREYGEDILNKEYFEAENKCLELMDEFLSIGNNLSKKKININLDSIKTKLNNRKSLIKVGNDNIEELKLNCKDYEKKIKELTSVVLPCLDRNQIKKIPNSVSDHYKQILEDNNIMKEKKNDAVIKKMDILHEYNCKEKELRDLKNQIYIIKSKSHQLNHNNNNNNNNNNN